MLDLPQTNLEKLEKFAMDAKKVGLRYIYIGNKWGGSGHENTYCYNCGASVIERTGFLVNKIDLIGDRCPNCQAKIDVVIE